MAHEVPRQYRHAGRLYALERRGDHMWQVLDGAEVIGRISEARDVAGEEDPCWAAHRPDEYLQAISDHWFSTWDEALNFLLFTAPLEPPTE